MDLIQIYAQLLAGEQICTGINQTKLQPKLRNLHGHILKSEHDKRIYNGSTKAAIGMTKLQLAAQSRWWTNLNGRGLPRSTDMQDLIQSPMTELIDRWPCSTRLDLHDLIWSMTTHLAYWIWSATGLEWSGLVHCGRQVTTEVKKEILSMRLWYHIKILFYCIFVYLFTGIIQRLNIQW